MKARIIGEGLQEYPVLAIDRHRVYTLGMPNGGTRSVGEERLVVTPEPPQAPKDKSD